MEQRMLPTGRKIYCLAGDKYLIIKNTDYYDV